MEKNLITKTKLPHYIPAINDKNKHGSLIQSFGNSIDQIADSPPVRELINNGADPQNIELIISVLILKTSYSLSVSGNLKEGQAKEIAKNILIDFPLLSLDDLHLCMLNGSKGFYGEIYRFDISVIYNWIREFENQKCDFVENKIMAEKSNYQKTDLTNELSPETKKLVDDFLIELGNSKIRMVNPVSKKDISKTIGYPGAKNVSSSESEIRERELHLQWIRENHDYRTGKKLDHWVDEKTWRENL